MLKPGWILFIAFGYIGLLFCIAYYGRKRADSGRSIIANSYIFALSLAVYCTAWTFYGSVGLAARTGLSFITVYMGPTLTAALGIVVLKKILRITKVQRITTIADFIASRYGKSTALGGVVTIIAVLGVVPYISLQLQAISTSFTLISHYPSIETADIASVHVFKDTAFYVTLILAVFAILFGTRHLEATERHEGLVAAIAFESVVKLAAFFAVGIFVTYGIFNGFGDIVTRASAAPDMNNLLTLADREGVYANWFIYIFLSMMAVIFLPRQFQVTFVENVNEDHLNKAVWLFPLYLLAINIFVPPIAMGGRLVFPDGKVNADLFALALPMSRDHQFLALLVFIGGMSAATSMVIVETVALSTMICNDLTVPVMLRLSYPGFTEEKDLSRLLLLIRRAGIILILLLGYTYFRFVGHLYTLVSIGLISFAAVIQFAPPILLGIFWKGGTRNCALAGLVCGFVVWGYTLILPTMASAGLFTQGIVSAGPFGISWLRPTALFGMTSLDYVAHCVFWSILANTGAYLLVSMFSNPTAMEHAQAVMFVDVFRYAEDSAGSDVRRSTASVADLITLLGRFLGPERAAEALRTYAKSRNLPFTKGVPAEAGIISHAEALLTGVIGSASARIMVASVAKEEPLGAEEVMNILDETRQVIAYSRELEKATRELKAANERLKELDRLKDEFISTVTHELRTPLTSIRSLAEILHDTPEIDPERHERFSAIIIKESERLTRLINQVLDVQKMEAGRMEWQMGFVNMREVVVDALATFDQLIRERRIQVELDLPESVPQVPGDRDRIMQVLLNLISNALKFCDPENGTIGVRLKLHDNRLQVDVRDNGRGIASADRRIIFEKFRQLKNPDQARPSGSGLGLTIARRIVRHHGGRIWVDGEGGEGACFSFTIPVVGPKGEGHGETGPAGRDAG